MFCKHCSCEVTEEMIVCPKCGKELSDTVDTQPEDTTVQVKMETETVEAEIISPVYHDESMNRGNQIHDLQFAVKPNVVVDAETPIQNTPEDNLTEATTKQFNKIWILIPVIIILIIALVIAIIVSKNKTPNKSNNPDVATTQEITTAATDSDSEITLVPTEEEIGDNTLIIGDNKIQPVSVKSYVVEGTDTKVTEFVYNISAEDARLYMDTEETEYQLSDDILDVAYVNGIFRYHYAGVYQYGLYTDKLIIYSVADSITVEEADVIALGLFNKEAK